MNAVSALFLSLLLLNFATAGRSNFSIATSMRADRGPAEAKPVISTARLRRKRLIVAGQNFDARAVILIDGERQETERDDAGPDAVLIARKAASRISDSEPVILQIENGDGESSEEFGFFRGTTITYNAGRQSIQIHQGERFLVRLGTFYDWALSFSDKAAFTQVPIARPIRGVQGFFEATAPGEFELQAHGDPACYKSRPPCLMPSIYLETAIRVSS